MTEFICPACGGGFPGDAMPAGHACPWCHWQLADGTERCRDVRTGMVEGRE